MFILKLYNNWLEEAEKKIGYKRKPTLSKRQINELIKLIKQCKVIESTDKYTIYQGE